MLTTTLLSQPGGSVTDAPDEVTTVTPMTVAGDRAPASELCVESRKAPRRRGEVLSAAIFDATIHELTEVGYAELTMERVANRASASKGSLYRRWSSRADLVMDAVHYRNPVSLQLPDTGSVREDVLGFLNGFAQVLNGPSGEAVRGLMAEMVRDPELMAVVRARFIEPSTSLLLEAMRKGVVRGEVRPTALTPLVANVGPALIRQHFLLYGGPIAPSDMIEIVDNVIMPLIRA